MALIPVGPLPASTYWRRRAVVLVGLVVLLLLVKACAPGGSKHPAASTTTPKPTATPSPAPSRTPTARPTSAAPAATASLCADSALTLTTTTDATTYALGATPRITLVVKNTGPAACRRDLGAGAVELLVFSGTDRVWSSDDCNPSKAASLVVLGPGGTAAVVQTWPGRRSLPQCAGSRAAAAAGTYRVVARVGTRRQDGAVFRLHA